MILVKKPGKIILIEKYNNDSIDNTNDSLEYADPEVFKKGIKIKNIKKKGLLN